MQIDKKKKNVSPPDVRISKKHHSTKTRVTLWQKEASHCCGEIAGARGWVAAEIGYTETLKVLKFRKNSEATTI